MTQLSIGNRVVVTASNGGLFYAGNKDKHGVVTRTSRAGEIVHVRFDDGVEDYGRSVDVELLDPRAIQVGSKVTVTAEEGGVFLRKYAGKTGEVYRVDEDTVYVQFEDGRDYGRMADVTLVYKKDSLGFISNEGNTQGIQPVPRGTLMDVLYNDGTLILDIPVGTGASKSASNNSNSYSATSWRGIGGAGIKAYRFPADRPTPIVSRRITHAEMKEGMKVRFLGADTRGHEHWNFVVGQVYSCGNGGPISVKGTLASNNWGDWKWELVEQAATLDDHLTELRTQLDAIKAEKTQAESELAAAQAKVDGIEARRVVLVGSLTKHGIQFIGEAVPVRTAQEAFDADELDIGMTLLCVTPHNTDEHTAGKQYKIVRRDVGDDAEFRLESDDGYGYWLDNEGLVGYTVVA